MKRRPGRARSAGPFNPAGFPGRDDQPQAPARQGKQGDAPAGKQTPNERCVVAVALRIPQMAAGQVGLAFRPARSSRPGCRGRPPPGCSREQISGKRLARSDTAGSWLPANRRDPAWALGVSAASARQRSTRDAERRSRPRPGCGRPPAPPTGTPRPGAPMTPGAEGLVRQLGRRRRPHACLPVRLIASPWPRQLLVRLLDGARGAAPALSHLPDGRQRVTGTQLAVQHLLADGVCESWR